MVRTEIRGVDVQQAFRIISDDSYRAQNNNHAGDNENQHGLHWVGLGELC